MALSNTVWITLAIVCASLVEGSMDRKDRQDPDWWKTTTVYQIYPRSFKDSDNDGTGDLKGIQSELDYFVDLGIETVWLSPIFKSPMKDFGYDVSDFIDIDPIFGTLEDFKDLLEAAHSRGLKIVMDYVPNHSSDQHEWFQKSLEKEDPYTDYYVWEDAIGFDNNGDPIPPNNWLSYFRYSAWEWNEQRQQFYLHQFVKEQPDLNYRNPLVLKEMQDVLTFWMELGVDGFRMDAVAYMWEDEQLLDEPLSGDPSALDEFDYFYLDHIYTNNLAETRDIILAAFDQTIKEFGAQDGYPRVNMLEVYLDIQDHLQYYECSDFPFNFYLISNTAQPPSAVMMFDAINYLLDNIEEDQVPNWVLGNHDNWRVGYRLGPKVVDTMNMILLTLPGVSVSYYGEEIGMTNNMNITFEQTVDPSGCNCGPQDYNEEVCSRDPERTPMQWNNGPNAGFNEGGPTWLPLNDNYVSVNVENQRDDPYSHFSIYKKMIALRQETALRFGSTVTKTIGNVLVVGRISETPETVPTFVLVANFAETSATVDLSEMFSTPQSDTGVVVVATDLQSDNSEGSIVSLQSITLSPMESFVFQL